MTEQTFADGNMTPVVRIGDEVRRALAQGWQAIHAVLRHLEALGFTQAPRLLRHDDTYQWLTYVPGRSIDADLAGFRDESFLIQVGALIRDYHTAMATFVAPTDIAWPPTLQPASDPDTICHNDIAPWNLIVDDDGCITALIDWDIVQPGKRTWDLAYAAWRFGVIGGGDPDLGDVTARADRIRWLLDAYGLPASERTGFVDVLRKRERAGFDVVEILGARGVPGYATLYDKGAHHWGLPARHWLDAHHAELRRLLEP